MRWAIILRSLDLKKGSVEKKVFKRQIGRLLAGLIILLGVFSIVMISI